MIYRMLVTPRTDRGPLYRAPLEVQPHNKEWPRGMQYPTALMYVSKQMHDEYAAVLYKFSTVKIAPGKITGRHVPDDSILRTDLVRGKKRDRRGRTYVTETTFTGCIYPHILTRFGNIHLVLEVAYSNALGAANLRLLGASQMVAIFTALSPSASPSADSRISPKRKGLVLQVYTCIYGSGTALIRDRIAGFLAREFNRLGCERLLTDVLEENLDTQIMGLSDMQIGALLDGLN